MLLLLALLVIRLLGDRWWPALPLLYGPRWLLGPLVLVPLLAVRRDAVRPTVAAVLVATVLYGLVLDVRIPWRSMLAGGSDNDVRLRVVGWNAQGGGGTPDANALWLVGVGPDLAVISECSPRFADALEKLPGYTIHRSSDLCLMSRLPVVEWAPRDPRDFWEMNGSGAIARMTVELNGLEIVLGGVHLETPRDALEALAKFSFLSFPSSARQSREIRALEAEVARSWIAPPSEVRPLIVVGDFNQVVESYIYRKRWGDLRNAFSERGLGLGWTKRTSRFGVRIDHVLMDHGWVAEAVKLGPALGSDHRPVIVDLSRRTSP